MKLFKPYNDLKPFEKAQATKQILNDVRFFFKELPKTFSVEQAQNLTDPSFYNDELINKYYSEERAAYVVPSYSNALYSKDGIEVLMALCDYPLDLLTKNVKKYATAEFERKPSKYQIEHYIRMQEATGYPVPINYDNYFLFVVNMHELAKIYEKVKADPIFQASKIAKPYNNSKPGTEKQLYWIRHNYKLHANGRTKIDEKTLRKLNIYDARTLYELSKTGTSEERMKNMDDFLTKMRHYFKEAPAT